MNLFAPGFEDLVEQERKRREGLKQFAFSPTSVSFLAGPIQVIADQDAAERFAEDLAGVRISLIGVDTEFRSGHPPISLSGREYWDPSQVVPLVCSLAAWAGDPHQPGPANDLLICAVFDLRRPSVLQGLQRVFDLPTTWVAHSARGEYHALWACGIYPREDRLIDTYLTAVCLPQPPNNHATDVGGSNVSDEKKKQQLAKSRSLIGQCDRFDLKYPFQDADKDRLRKQYMNLGPDDELTSEMVEYAVADAEFAVHLHLAQQSEVLRYDLTHHLATYEYPLVAAVARMELRGVPFNSETADRLDRMCEELLRFRATELEKFGIQAGSSKSFLAAMRAAGLSQHFIYGGKETTKKEVLKRAKERHIHAAVPVFLDHRNLKLHQTTLRQMQRVRGKDGRIRGSIDQLQAATGRMASRSPNLIGLSRVMRPVIEAPSGRVLVEVDYSQIEVGIAAAVWKDPVLMRLFNEGDVYSTVAQQVFQSELTAEESSLPSAEFKKRRPDLRDRAKVVFLGLLYGLSAKGLAQQLQIDVAAAEGHLKKLFEICSASYRGGELAVRHAIQRGSATSISGFKRFIARTNTQDNALRNHPIQSGAMVVFKRALLTLDREFLNTDTLLLLPRHDSVLLECPRNNTNQVIQRAEAIMIEAVKELFPELQPKVDAKFGSTWPTNHTLAQQLDAAIADVHP